MIYAGGCSQRKEECIDSLKRGKRKERREKVRLMFTLFNRWFVQQVYGQ